MITLGRNQWAGTLLSIDFLTTLGLVLVLIPLTHSLRLDSMVSPHLVSTTSIVFLVLVYMLDLAQVLVGFMTHSSGLDSEILG